MKKINGFFISLLVVLAGCTSTKITNSWNAENIESKPYKKVLVLGLINEPDRNLREKMEEHVVADLRALGYTAVCSCDEFNPKTFENLTEQQALDKLSKSGIDAVLTVVLLDKTKERYYVPGRVRYSPYFVYQDRFYGYYRTMYSRVYAPGYYEEDTKYFWESNFYELGNRNLLYSVQSQSFEPATSQSLAHEYGQMIVKDMVDKKVLKRQTLVP